MQKIISLFKRDYEGTRLIYDAIVPGAEWVQAGEGTATVKWDGTSCMIEDGILYRRYDARQGRVPPQGFIPAQDADPVTGHWPGWVACQRNNPADRWHFEALDVSGVPTRGDYTTFELVGPKVQGNPHHYAMHYLVPHGQATLPDAPRTFNALKTYFEAHPDFEGIVWHHPDGRMVKVKRKDFGLPWPEKH